MGLRAGAVLVLGLTLCAAPADGQSAFVRGTVTAAQDGRPLPELVVLLKDRAGGIRQKTVSDSMGRFLFEILEPARYSLTVEGHPDELPSTQLLQVRPGDELEVTIHLDPLFRLESVGITALPPMVTERVREFRERAAFNQSLGRGKIYTREDILRLQPRNAEAMLGAFTVGRCRPEIILDNSSVTAPELRSITPANMEGVEFYLGSDIPRIYQRPGRCGVVLIWTRSQPEGMRRMGAGRMLIATLFATISFILLR